MSPAYPSPPSSASKPAAGLDRHNYTAPYYVSSTASSSPQLSPISIGGASVLTNLGGDAPPLTPHMRPVPLPASPAYPPSGLVTPPQSPLTYRRPALALNPALCPPAVFIMHALAIYVNLAKPLSAVAFAPPSAHLAPGALCTPAMLAQPATNPPTRELRLALPGFAAWGVRASGVSAQAVIETLWTSLRTSVGRAEWDAQPRDVRDAASLAFARRVQVNEEERRGGLRRLDFFGNCCVFAGLRADGAGGWQVMLIPHA